MGEAIKRKLKGALRDSLPTCMDIMNPLNLHSWEEQNQNQDCDPQETTLCKDSNQVMTLCTQKENLDAKVTR